VFGLLLLFVLPVRLFSFLARLFCWFGSCCFSVFKTTTFAKCIINISLKDGGSFLLRRAAGYHTCLIIFNQFEHFSLYYVAVFFFSACCFVVFSNPNCVYQCSENYDDAI
jgi:hypothetical protein